MSTTPPGTPDRRLHTAFCDLVGVRYPIVQTGMGWVSGSRLTAATARAGGLGIIAAAPMTFDQMVAAIDEVRESTDAPFGVNLRIDAGDIIRRVEHLITAEVRVA
nr:nitronate monooxygenase [Acidimicrobiales bacterium]